MLTIDEDAFAKRHYKGEYSDMKMQNEGQKLPNIDDDTIREFKKRFNIVDDESIGWLKLFALVYDELKNQELPLAQGVMNATAEQYKEIIKALGSEGGDGDA